MERPIDDIELPRLIHFIWAGGKRHPDKDQYETLFQWAEKNPDFNINLWVDEQTDPMARSKYTQDILRFYKEYLAKKMNVLEDEIQESDVNKILGQVLVEDISDNTYGVNFRDEYVSYEIDKLTPNYGSSSDLLRYNILLRCGGAYFDLDVLPGKDRLAQLEEYQNLSRDVPLKKHVLYVDHCSQRPDVAQEILENFGTSKIGNDTYITTKGNPLMYKMLQDARNNYHLANEKIQDRIEVLCTGKDIKSLTIGRTGPVVTQILVDEGNLKSGEFEFSDGLVKRVRDGSHEFAKPADANTCSWLKARVSKCESLQDAFERVRQTMAFELKIGNLVRIDDHVQDIVESCHVPAEAVYTEVASKVLKMCSKLKLTKDTLILNTGHSPGVSNHFSTNKSIFNLNNKELTLALEFLTQPEYVIFTSRRLLSDSYLHHQSVSQIMVNLFDKNINDQLSYMNQRLAVMHGLISNIEKFPKSQKSLVINTLNEIVNNYKEYITISKKILEKNNRYEKHSELFEKSAKNYDNISNKLKLQQPITQKEKGPLKKEQKPQRFMPH